jgi:hypothetical protein
VAAANLHAADAQQLLEIRRKHLNEEQPPEWFHMYQEQYRSTFVAQEARA